MSLTTQRTADRSSRPLAEKTCLVTGASRGIGRAIALELGRSGAAVAVNYRSSRDAAETVAETITEVGETATTVQSDVADPTAVETMADIVREELGPIDVLVNNAGITADNRFEHMTRAEWDRVIDVNLGGTFNCSQTFFEDIKSTRNGRIINIASVVGRTGNFGQANYAASKSGLIGLTKTLAIELAATTSTANCIAPGFTETDMLATVPDRVREVILADIPVNRFADPEDLAGLVRFIASDDSSYMTGQIIGVDGGMTS